MLKLKKIIKTIVIFVLIMILICFFISLFNLFNHEIEFNEVFSKTALYFLYTIGYGALEGDAVLQNILAMVGIVSLALMSTFLTINLFWRLDDVALSKTVTFNDDILGFQFNNNGRAICDMKASFIIYDEFTSENLGEPKEYYMPILLKNSHWNLKVNLSETFWYRAIYDLLTSKDKKLYCIFSFVDAQNGQSSIRVEEINKNYIKKNNQFLEYEEFIKPLIIECNRLQAVENGGKIALNYENNMMNVNYDFFENANNNSFIMAFYNFHNNLLNLEKYNKESTYLEFNAVSSKRMNLKLEFKMANLSTCAKDLELSEEAGTFRIPVSEIDGDLENISEICFTVFCKNNPNINDFQIGDLRIITR